MSLGSEYNALVNKGRKAGLSTRELYSALSTRPAEVSDRIGQADGNGFVSGFNQHGQRVYRPVGGYPRP
jgi:hypothetical protein